MKCFTKLKPSKHPCSLRLNSFSTEWQTLRGPEPLVASLQHHLLYVLLSQMGFWVKDTLVVMIQLSIMKGMSWLFTEPPVLAESRFFLATWIGYISLWFQAHISAWHFSEMLARFSLFSSYALADRVLGPSIERHHFLQVGKLTPPGVKMVLRGTPSLRFHPPRYGACSCLAAMMQVLVLICPSSWVCSWGQVLKFWKVLSIVLVTPNFLSGAATSAGHLAHAPSSPSISPLRIWPALSWEISFAVQTPCAWRREPCPQMTSTHLTTASQKNSWWVLGRRHIYYHGHHRAAFSKYGTLGDGPRPKSIRITRR